VSARAHHSDEETRARHDAAAPIAAKSRAAYRDLKASSLGIELAVSILIGLFFGRWLDGQTDTSPLFMIVFLLFGCAAGFRAVLRAWKVEPTPAPAEPHDDHETITTAERDAEDGDREPKA
jgi:F0F1-type ATP synthase assembly protein I